MKNILYLFLVFYLSSCFSYSQNISWERVGGPYGGFVSVIYQSSSGKIYAGARGLLYSKYSNEEEWYLALRTNYNSTATTIVENSRGDIFASFGNGTYRSTDNGNTWTIMNSGISGVSINKLTIDDQDNLYTTTLIYPTARKIYKSNNNGLSWEEIYNYSFTVYDFSDIKAGPNGLILAGGFGYPDYLLRSTDYGQSWDNISYPNLSPIYRLLIISNTEMYATETNKEIWKSTDNGENWFVISLAPNDQWISFIRNDPNNNLYLGLQEDELKVGWAGYGGVYKSTDHGLTWTENLTFNLKNRQVQDLEFIDNDTIWIGTYGKGVQQLIVSDTIWNDNNKGINDININDVTFDNSQNLWLCTSRGGIFYSSDGGINWKEHSNGLLIPSGYEIKVSNDNTTLLADALGLYKYDDADDTWIKKLSPPEVAGQDYIDCEGIKNIDTLFVGDLIGGIAVSFDNGESWDWNPPYYFQTNAIKVLRDGTVLAAGNSVYKTTNNGISWENFYSCGYYNHISIEQTDDDFILTACNEDSSGYLFLSTDYGQTQTNLTDNINNPLLSCIKYYNNDRIFIGTSSYGIYLTTNLGKEWQSVNEGLNNFNILSLAIDDSGYIFAGTSEGLYRSINPFVIPVELKLFNYEFIQDRLILKWETVTETNNHGFEIQRNFEDTKWLTVGFIEGKGNTTEAQSYSFTEYNLISGNYKYRLKQIDFNGSFEYSNILDVKINVPTIFSLSQNYPNPFNPTTKIKYQLPELSKVKLTVYDILGREIKTLVNEEKPAGSYEVEFDGSRLPSGIYFYKIVAGKFSDTKKFILLK